MANVDQSSLIDRAVPAPEKQGKVLKKHTQRAEGSSVSAAIGRENARLGMPGPTMPRFPGEDAGRSLAEMARIDLDAALQLLADRAQYITGASGAAIALRRGKHNDMLCRARVGSNAPELGTLLSMEFGLSGESVRTQQLLRCEDAERDPRVNRELCRELSIASVVIMPILREQQVLGIFELLSGKAKAFSEHDLSALTRLAEMVVTALKHSGLEPETIAPQKISPETAAKGSGVTQTEVAQTHAEGTASAAELPPSKEVPREDSRVQSAPSVSPKKTLFWSAALQAQADARSAEAVEVSGVPTVLRNLKKCQACGFPVSQSRTFCVECEEKQWHGRSAAQLAAAGSAETPKSSPELSADKSARAQVREAAHSIETLQPAAAKLAITAAASGAESVISKDYQSEPTVVGASAPPTIVTSPIETPANEQDTAPVNAAMPESPIPFLSSAVPTESWLAAHKYIVLVLFIVALVLMAIAHFH